MNVAFFLTPKRDVHWLSTSATFGEAVRELERHGHSAVPVLDREGRYVRTLTEGDLLRYACDAGVVPTGATVSGVPLVEVPSRRAQATVRIDVDVETLLRVAAEQSFVPVEDDRGAFVGIVRRRAILTRCADLLERPAARRWIRPT